jgi:disulfide bond formation protein DsbB
MKKLMLFIIWLQAIVATLGSLYFSEIMHLTPCTLCWYQRICMYPLAAIMTVGLFRKDTKIYSYVFPLSIIGLIIAGYHNLLVYNIISEKIVTCTAGVPCGLTIMKWFGFITIPLLSFTAFLIINSLMILYILFPKIIRKNSKTGN